MVSKKRANLFLSIFGALLLLFLIPNVTAQIGISDELLNFYSQDISKITLSNDSLLLFSDADRSTLYYMYYNPLNVTLNLTTNIACTSKKCPTSSQLTFDYVVNDTTLPFVKKAAGIFVMTNDSSLGKYTYDVVVFDSSLNYTQKASLKVEIISSSFWRQFWHNLLSLF